MSFPRLQELEVIPSAELKKFGWRDLHERLKGSPAGVLAIGSDQCLEGVLLTPEVYTRLIRLAGHRTPEEGAVLGEVRRELDQRLAPLSGPGAAKRLRNAVNEPLFTDDRFLTGDPD